MLLRLLGCAVGFLAGEEVGEEEDSADASDDGFGGRESTGAEAGCALAIDVGHVGDGDVAEGVDDGVAAGA